MLEKYQPIQPKKEAPLQKATSKSFPDTKPEGAEQPQSHRPLCVAFTFPVVCIYVEALAMLAEGGRAWAQEPQWSEPNVSVNNSPLWGDIFSSQMWGRGEVRQQMNSWRHHARSEPRTAKH